jgi:hypothetical protein
MGIADNHRQNGIQDSCGGLQITTDEYPDYGVIHNEWIGFVFRVCSYCDIMMHHYQSPTNWPDWLTVIPMGDL